MTAGPADFNASVVAEFRANGPRHPAWYHNVLANPDVTVEDGMFTYRARATVLTGAERDAVFARAVEQDSDWAAYQRGTDRTLPVVALEAAGPPEPGAGGSPGTMLRRVHDAFRRELELIRAEVAASGSAVGAQLRITCLTLCNGLHAHHSLEDESLFPAVDAQRPDLAGAMVRLRAEHEAIAAVLAELRRVLDDTGLDRAALLAEVDRLTTAVEGHLAYEEDMLIPVLDPA